MAVLWWSKAYEILINNERHAFNRMKRTRDPLDIVIFKRARAKAKLTLNKAKKILLAELLLFTFLKHQTGSSLVNTKKV